MVLIYPTVSYVHLESGHSANIIGVCSGYSRFEYRLGHWLSWGVSCFSSVPPDKCGIVSRLGHDHFNLNYFKFVIYLLVCWNPSRLTTIPFLRLNPSDRSLCVPSSLAWGWACVLWLCLALSSIRIAYMACYYKFFHVQCKFCATPCSAK
jgi:hypothetical protein